MNKKLKNYVEQQLLPYQNEAFLTDLKEQQRDRRKERKEKYKKLIPVCFSIGGAVAAIAVILLCVFLINPSQIDRGESPQAPSQLEPVQENPPKIYSGGQINVDCEIEELNDDLQFIALSGNNYLISKFIDDVYDDTLYYHLIYSSEDELETVTLKVSMNPDYRLEGVDKQYERTGTVATFVIQYDEEVNYEDEIYFFTESGVIKTDHEIIVVTAEIIGLEENSNFIELMNEIIKAK